MRNKSLTLGAALAGFLVVSPAAFATNFGPTPYLTTADSPWTAVSFSSFHLETFETYTPKGQLDVTGPHFNLAGVTQATSKVAGTGPIDNTIQAVAGIIDSVGGNGLGTNGSSLYDPSGSAGITILFSGLLPTHAGVVWTDGAGTINFEAFNNLGASLGIISGTHADNFITGTTAEDRFYGASFAAGISSFRIWNTSGGIEVDHLQFGIANSGIPTPDSISTLAGLATCFLGLVALRRRK